MILIAQGHEIIIDTQFVYKYYMELERDNDQAYWKIMAAYVLDDTVDDEIGCFSSAVHATIIMSNIAKAIANNENYFIIPDLDNIAHIDDDS